MVGGGRKPMFRTIALAAAIATLGGCGQGKRIPAVGPGSEIVVMSSPGLRPIRGQVLEILSREVRVVHFEPTFDTVEADLADHSFYKTRKLLFAVGTPEDADLAKFLRGATGTQTRSQFPGLWIVTEPFSAGQILFVLSGTVEALREVLAERPDDLLAVVEEAAVTLMLTNLFRAGEVPGARDDMLAAWGWGVRVPPNWVVDQRYARERFVRVWRDSPVEQLFVAWEPGRVQRTVEEWLARRDELVQRYYDGDTVVAARSEGSVGPTPYDLDGVLLSGLWENAEYVIGGPFRSWAFHCPHDNRTYLVDVCVYAPDRPKRPLMRTLEAVARTFRCGCVPATGRRGRPS
jgi:hypothetical protein